MLHDRLGWRWQPFFLFIVMKYIRSGIRSSESEARGMDEKRRQAIEQLRTFGKTHGLSLGGMTIRELCHEAHP
jgi:hypothetical protein